MKDKKTKVWLIIHLISLVLLVLMGLISNAIAIGERLRGIHFSLEIIFYVLVAIVVIAGIIYPIVGVFFEPIFSLDQLHDVNGNAKFKWCKKLTDNLITNVDLTPEEQVQVRGFLHAGNDADDKLIEFFDRKISPEINKEIFKASRRAFIVTAASQNSFIDMLGMLSLNFLLVKKITELCGFRPTNLQVMRIFTKVLFATIIAGVLEEANVEGVITKIIESITDSPLTQFIGTAVSSLLQGTANALTTLRIGFITKNYLLNADVSKTRKELRKEAFKDAMAALPVIVKDDIKAASNKIKSVFTKKNTSDDTETDIEKEKHTSNPAKKLFNKIKKNDTEQLT